MLRSASLVISVSLLAACPAATPNKCNTPKAAAVANAVPTFPAFPLAALQGPHALRAKIYVSPTGKLRKYAVYVTKEGIPAWVHALADKELGKGEDTEYEVEQYENGDTVYEIARKVDGKEVELSVLSKTRKKLYIERSGLRVNEAPEAVQKAAASIEGFAPEALEVKEYTDRKVYELEGKRAGKSYTVYFASDGKVIRQGSSLPAKITIDR